MNLNFVEIIKGGFTLQAERNKCKVTDLKIVLSWDVVQSALLYNLLKNGERIGELNFTKDILGKDADVFCTDMIVNAMSANLIDRFCKELEVKDAANIPAILILIWFDGEEMTDNQLRGGLRYGKENIREIDLLNEFTL